MTHATGRRAHSVHRNALEGYSRGAAAYDAGRSAYPAAALARVAALLELVPGRIVVELGAGTGKFTQQLAATGAQVIAIEPLDEMRNRLARAVGACANVEVMPGTAEAIPREFASADAVVAAMAFHWFDGEAALREIDRVLRPSGRLALLWNERDVRIEWVAKLQQLLSSVRRGSPSSLPAQWQHAFAASAFAEIACERFANVELGDAETVLDRMRSTSFVALLPEGEQSEFLRRVQMLISSDPSIGGRTEFEIPEVTVLYGYARKPS